MCVQSYSIVRSVIVPTYTAHQDLCCPTRLYGYFTYCSTRGRFRGGKELWQLKRKGKRAATMTTTHGNEHDTYNGTANNGSGTRVFALWDPCSPITLLLPSAITTATTDAATTETTSSRSMVSIKGIYCSTGVNCNSYETKALLDILEYREEFQSWVLEERRQGNRGETTTTTPTITTSSSTTTNVFRKLRWLSQSYRKALSTCLFRSSQLDHNWDSNDDVAKELLKCMSAIMQLSEIFLVPYPISTNTILTDDYGITEDDGMDLKDDFTATKTISLPGSLTANTIRYLRVHHLPNKWHALQPTSSTTTPEDDEEESHLRYLLEEMLSSDQPEQWRGTTTATTAAITTESSSLYWKLIQSLVKRGCLKDAWYVLSHHSYYDTNTANNNTTILTHHHHHHLQQGFLYLRAILLSAPIPGGRTDTLDDILPPWNRTEGQPQEQYDTSFPIVVQDEYNEQEEEASLLTNIPSNAHEGWGCTTTKDTTGNDGAGTASGIRTSKSYYTLWSNLIATAYNESNPNGPLSTLLQHIPELRWAVLDIISGQFLTITHSTSSSNINFDGWAEALCAELLYKHPMIRPEDIPIRAQATMEAYSSSSSFTSTEEMQQEEGGDNFINHIVLSIMKKDAGTAIDALHKFGGGSSAGKIFLSLILF
jgi:hypothetical protein